MQQFRPAHIIPYALFSTAFYRDVIKRWQGWGLLYPLIILAIGMLVTAYHFHGQLSQPNNPPRTLLDFIITGISELPSVAIEDGKFFAPGDAPVDITIDSPHLPTPLPVILVDTSIGTPRSNSHLITLTSEAAWVHYDGQQNPIMRAADLQEMFANAQKEGELHFNGNDLINAIQENASFIATWAYIIAVVGLYIKSLIWIILFASISLMLAGWMRLALTLKTAIRLSATAYTPVLLLTLLTFWLGHNIFAYSTAVYITLQAIITWRALESIKK